MEEGEERAVVSAEGEGGGAERRSRRVCIDARRSSVGGKGKEAQKDVWFLVFGFFF